MTIETTLETIADYLPQDLPVKEILSGITSYIPAQVDFGNMFQFLLLYAAGSMILATLGRFALGKRSSLNHSLSSAMGILFIYAVTILVYVYKPWELNAYLSPLPFVTFAKDYLILLPIANAGMSALCQNLLSLIMLAFLVNLIDTLTPHGDTILTWFIFRGITVVLSMMLHLILNLVINLYIPDLIVSYAPVALLVILIGMIVLGFVNAVLGLILTIVNPVIGGIYTFFFSNLIGKQITKAVFTSAILCAVVYCLEYFGFLVIAISADSLAAYIPLALVSLFLWFFIGFFL